MARPIRIPIVSDVSGFLKGTDDVERSLDDVSGSLDNLSREAQGVGDDAGRALSDGIEDGARDAERAVEDLADSGRNLDEIGDRGEQAFEQVSDAARSELGTAEERVDALGKSADDAADKMEKSFRDAFDSVKRESNDVGDSARRGFDEASEGAANFRDEANSTAREAAASFDGSAESIGDAFQEVTANAFGGFGAAGAAAGLAAAAGLGLIFSELEKSKEETQRFKERVSELTAEFADVEFEGGSALENIYNRMRELSEVTEDGETSLRDLYDVASEVSGIDFSNVAEGFAGNDEALQATISGLKEYREKLQENSDAELEISDARKRANIEERDDITQLLELLEKEQDKRQTARENEELLHLAGLEDIQEEQEAQEARAERRKETTEAIIEREREVQQGIREEISETTAAWEESWAKIEEDGEITSEELAQSFEDMLTDQRKKAELWKWAQQNLTTDQMAALEAHAGDTFEVLEALVNQPPDLRQQTLNNMQQIGEQKSRAQVEGFEREMQTTVDGPRVVFRPDDSDFRYVLREIGEESVRVPVYLDAVRNYQVAP